MSLSRRQFALGLGALSLPSFAAAKAKQFRVYIGTYSRGESKGIYSFVLDTGAATLKPEGLAVEAENPSFLAIHPSGNYVYAVGETEKYKTENAGSISAFKIDHATGKLQKLNDASSGGAGPCHVNVSRNGQFLVAANYGAGSCCAYAIDATGALGKRTAFHQHSGSSVSPRQTGPHAHSVNFDRANKHVIVADLGLDKVLAYKFNAATGAMEQGTAASLKPGSGPRHFSFHPKGKFAYVINELTCTVTAFKWNNGTLTEIETVTTLPEPLKQGYSTAEVVAHPNGRFLYGSNRGHNTIAVFQIDQATGKLKSIEHKSTQGAVPRNFAIDPTGQFLIAANQNSNTIVLFRINQQTGALDAVGAPIPAPVPVCVRYLQLRRA
ncbi:MAG: lactonase family protein [Acidobacteria bacterium]|nr:lactonase family protein [Acidobacteriota bacterium]